MQQQQQPPHPVAQLWLRLQLRRAHFTNLMKTFAVARPGLPIVSRHRRQIDGLARATAVARASASASACLGPGHTFAFTAALPCATAD